MMMLNFRYNWVRLVQKVANDLLIRVISERNKINHLFKKKLHPVIFVFEMRTIYFCDQHSILHLFFSS